MPQSRQSFPVLIPERACVCGHPFKLQLFGNFHSLIQEFIRCPFKKSTQRRPSPTTTIQISLEQPAKCAFITLKQEAYFQGESISGGGTNNGECAMLLSCSFST